MMSEMGTAYASGKEQPLTVTELHVSIFQAQVWLIFIRTFQAIRSPAPDIRATDEFLSVIKESGKDRFHL